MRGFDVVEEVDWVHHEFSARAEPLQLSVLVISGLKLLFPASLCWLECCSASVFLVAAPPRLVIVGDWL